jgi:hypothetical protein
MKHFKNALLAAALATVSVVPLVAAQFSSGSDGSYGDVIVLNGTTATLDIPADGVFRCGRVTVGSGATLRFNANPLNTAVYLLCTNDVLISGTIDITGADNVGAVPGKGGPGGFDGGFGGFGDSAPLNRGGDGHGPGGGRNGTGTLPGVYAAVSGANDRVYGNVLIVPLIGGSGAAGVNGNPGNGGGGGGGAILIASDTQITVNGTINANGGYGPYGGGSGGSIRLVAPTGGGSGSLAAQGRASGSNGRVRIDCQDNLAFRNLSVRGSSTRGTRMFVFPASTPSLHIIHAAGQDIPQGAPAAVNIELPAGSPAAQTIRVRGVNFSGTVPIQILVTPEHTAATTYDLNLNGAGNPAEVEAQVSLPVGELVRIEAWAR